MHSKQISGKIRYISKHSKQARDASGAHTSISMDASETQGTPGGSATMGFL